ncbi:NADPH-dependent F420 reductase [Burkholderia cepacia]|uniref:NADPH-dependent F420 reductase n=1 Tax=Burkholderia cepacia TaxID=292 RepID=UPI002AB72175|nr:NADPH-dependent F420 reductase [Burkholderia cepacia]
MKIGIIGAGALGSNLAKALANRQLSAIISNRRGPESLAALVDELGPSIQAGTVEQAAKCDLVVLAVRWDDLEAALHGLPAWNGRIVVDATNALAALDPDSPEAADPDNPLAAYGIKVVDTNGRLSSEIVAERVPGARLVRAFNHFEVELLPEPDVSGGQRVMFYSGDDLDAKRTVGELIEQLGMIPIDLGDLIVGAALTATPFGPLSMANFIRMQ